MDGPEHDTAPPRRGPARLTRISGLAGAVVLAGVAMAGCGGGDGGDAATRVDTTLRGEVIADGSSTVAPLTQAAADAFTAHHPLVDVQVRISGTGGGFRVFCLGQTDISDASRRISADEARACAAHGVEYEAFRVASDGITLVTKDGADVGTDCLTFPQLRRIWAKGSAIDNWRQVDPRLADAPLDLAGPGSESGTYDYFNEKVLGVGPDGEPRTPRTDYTASENDDVIVAAVERAPAGLGYFGYSYYATNAGHLTPFKLDAGDGEGCIAPSVDTINRGDYPLARPLFIYVSRSSLKDRAVRHFVRTYLENAARYAQTASIVAAPPYALEGALHRLNGLGD